MENDQVETFTLPELEEASKLSVIRLKAVMVLLIILMLRLAPTDFSFFKIRWPCLS